MSLSLAKYRVPAWECNVCREVYYLGAEDGFVIHLAECGVQS